MTNGAGVGKIKLFLKNNNCCGYETNPTLPLHVPRQEPIINEWGVYTHIENLVRTCDFVIVF